jgi:hypothetical protein
MSSPLPRNTEVLNVQMPVQRLQQAATPPLVIIEVAMEPRHSPSDPRELNKLA